MSKTQPDRYLRLSGTPYQVGLSLGRALEGQLSQDIHHYIETGPAKFSDIDPGTFLSGAMDWFETLPLRFRQEIEGMAKGSGVPLNRIAQWGFADAGGRKSCSGFIFKSSEYFWVGRNNDLWVPDLWGYAIQRHIKGRLATITFGMRGEIFAATGLNQAGLWLHYNWLPSFDKGEHSAWTPFVLLTEILETCQNIDEAESALHEMKRTGGMLIFAAQENPSDASLLECACQQVARQNFTGSFLAGTNHYQMLSTPQEAGSYAPESVSRLAAIRAHFSKIPEAPTIHKLISILADPKVEQHQTDFGTVYANLCSPTAHQLWFTFGGFPAASQGDWQKIQWPFNSALKH